MRVVSRDGSVVSIVIETFKIPSWITKKLKLPFVGTRVTSKLIRPRIDVVKTKADAPGASTLSNGLSSSNVAAIVPEDRHVTAKFVLVTSTVSPQELFCKLKNPTVSLDATELFPY